MISVVVPIFNEEIVLPTLYDRLTRAAAAWSEDFEIIAVDDGSQDNSLGLCLEFARKSPCFKVISFSRNFGHQAAVTAGLSYSNGDIVAIIDADLQDPPEELWRYIEKCREGYDVVYAVRTARKENVFKRASYWLYYRMLAALANIKIPLDSGDFCVMRRVAVDALNELPERRRFVRGLRTWVGYRQLGMTYERQAREAGEPKYNLARLFELALDGLLNFSYAPLRLLMLTGACVGMFAILGGVGVFLQYVTNTTIWGYNPHHARGWTSLILMMMFLSGTQLIALGILGEYVGRTFEEAKRRPVYLVKQQVGFGHEIRLHPGMDVHRRMSSDGPALP